MTLPLRVHAPIVRSITPTKDLDNAYRPIEPTESFRPYDTFYVSVELENYRAGDPLYARWYYENSDITQTSLNVNLDGDIFAGFVLHNDQPPWPAGVYRVDILYEEQLIGSETFRVERAP
jgi:hypothetical protein